MVLIYLDCESPNPTSPTLFTLLAALVLLALLVFFGLLGLFLLDCGPNLGWIILKALLTVPTVFAVLDEPNVWLEIHLGERGMSVPGTRLEDVVSDAFGSLDVKTVVLALWGFGSPRVHRNTVPLAGRDGLAPPPVGPLFWLLIDGWQGRMGHQLMPS